MRSGAAFSADNLDKWGYNTRNELTTSDRHAGTDPGTPGAEDADLGRDYPYDPIGNRRDYTKGSVARLYYCANQLNQYDETGADDQCDPATETFTHDEDGNLTSDGRFDQFLTDGSDQNGSGKPRPPAS